MNTPKLFQYGFSAITTPSGEEIRRPILPLTLASMTSTISTYGLVDSGADVNILPFGVGIRLGMSWEEARVGGAIGGAFGRIESRYVRLGMQIGNLPVQELVFLWLKSDDAPLLLGMTDFFLKYDVSFFLSHGYFEVKPSTPR